MAQLHLTLSKCGQQLSSTLYDLFDEHRNGLYAYLIGSVIICRVLECYHHDTLVQIGETAAPFFTSTTSSILSPEYSALVHVFKLPVPESSSQIRARL